MESSVGQGSSGKLGPDPQTITHRDPNVVGISGRCSAMDSREDSISYVEEHPVFTFPSDQQDGAKLSTPEAASHTYDADRNSIRTVSLVPKASEDHIASVEQTRRSSSLSMRHLKEILERSEIGNEVEPVVVFTMPNYQPAAPNHLGLEGVPDDWKTTPQDREDLREQWRELLDPPRLKRGECE
jgi:hypothetical protein